VPAQKTRLQAWRVKASKVNLPNNQKWKGGNRRRTTLPAALLIRVHGVDRLSPVSTKNTEQSAPRIETSEPTHALGQFHCPPGVVEISKMGLKAGLCLMATMDFSSTVSTYAASNIVSNSLLFSFMLAYFHS
jgi:hypothetical protein